ncbi:MAG: pyridoxamine 5'-phosphate oxidase family protein [Deltaproteobacteria bacterium]|nr:pyridoxamine 5'-phosphate oxidase family protein [Deltaproteobacteria bacterium]
MDSDLKNRITKYISECPACTLATATVDGEPNASTVFISNVGMDLYFNTAKDSQKIRNIQANPRVSIAMQKIAFPKTDAEISGIQYNGAAKILADDNLADVPGGVMARHKAFNSVKPGNAVIVKVTPKKIYLVDYSKGFRHRDVLDI